MVRRVKQHQLEDLSRSKFSLVIPNNWVCRDKGKDYGIDIEVEVFDNDGCSTGLVFWVQLKATESCDESVIKKIDMRIETIKYFYSIDIPVMIVRYSKTEDRFYFKWAGEIDMFYARKKAKTMCIKFIEENIWNEGTPSVIKGHLNKLKAINSGQLKLPTSINISVDNNNINGIPKGLFVSECRELLKEYSELASFTTDPNDSLFQVSICKDEMKVSLSLMGGCTFHNIRKRDREKFVECIVADSLIGCAVALTCVGKSELAARIVLDVRLKARFFQKQEILFRMMPLLLTTQYFEQVVNDIINTIDSEKDNFLEMITQTAIQIVRPVGDDKIEAIERFLNKCLEKYINTGNETQAGIAFYNLGNHYRSRSMHERAINCYLKARRNEKKYLNQSYYYQELGGSLFEIGKFCSSAQMYKIALEKGATGITKALYADALFFSGQYKMALNIFLEYFDSAESIDEEWILKKECLEMIIKSTGIIEQKRKKKEADFAADVKNSRGQDALQTFDNALKMDLLCGLAWFNLGIENSKAGNHFEAVINFTLCGLIQRGDVEAWANATLCCFNSEVPIVLLPLILRTAFFYNGDRYLSHLYKEMYKRFGSKALNIISEEIEKTLPKVGPKMGMPVVRIMGEDGIFRNIFESEE